MPTDRTLADGTVVEAHVLGRVLGLRLLRITATVVLSPTVGSTPTVVVPGTVAAPRRVLNQGTLRDAERLLTQARQTLEASRPRL